MKNLEVCLWGRGLWLYPADLFAGQQDYRGTL